MITPGEVFYVILVCAVAAWAACFLRDRLG